MTGERLTRTGGVRLIVFYKTIKGLAQLWLAVLLAFSLLWGGLPHELTTLSSALRHHTTAAWSVGLSVLLTKAATPRGVLLTSVALGLDGAVTSVEGWALRQGKTWGAWLVVAASGLLLPYEFYEFSRHPRLGRFVVLALNAAIVAYLSRKAHGERGARAAG